MQPVTDPEARELLWKHYYTTALHTAVKDYFLFIKIVYLGGHALANFGVRVEREVV